MHYGKLSSSQWHIRFIHPKNCTELNITRDAFVIKNSGSDFQSFAATTIFTKEGRIRLD